MFVACTFCGMAAGTSSFQPAGNLPAAWQGNVTEADLNEALKGELDNYQKYLADNDKTIGLTYQVVRSTFRRFGR
jgi:hypothetical protein